jgi:hypothetical protein
MLSFVSLIGPRRVLRTAARCCINEVHERLKQSSLQIDGTSGDGGEIVVWWKREGAFACVHRSD